MNVNNINNNDLVNNSNIRTDKANQSDKANIPANKETSPSNESSSAKDSVSITESHYGDEIQFARQVYAKLSKSSLSALKEIKSHIEKGDYDSDDITRAIADKVKSALLAGDAQTIQQEQSTAEAGRETASLTDSRRSELLNDPEVLRKITGGILRDINSASQSGK